MRGYGSNARLGGGFRKTVLDSVLLPLRHLIITRKAETSSEDIHTDVLRFSLVDICIALAAAISIGSDKCMAAVYRLSMLLIYNEN